MFDFGTDSVAADTDDDGYVYFWNSKTGESQWTNPWQKAMTKLRQVTNAFGSSVTS